MMPLRKLFLGSVIVLLLISGVVTDDDWGVSYTPNYICALKGSTVTMRCTYTYPSGYRIQKAFWSTELATKLGEPPDLASDPAYRNRIQYISDKENDCTLRLYDVTEQDQRRYYFRFITEQTKEKYQGRDGVLLSVTELRVEVSENVVAGTVVTLTCKTTCTQTYQTFTWYKNGQKLNSNYEWLYLVSVSREKAESYSCAVGDLQSPAVTLNVQYPPERVSVSISPSGEIMEGSSVTLTCSSDADPPVTENMYFWYKRETNRITSYKETGRIYTIKKISFEDSGEYYCRATNKHGYQDSITVNLNVLSLDPPKNFSVSISPSDEILEGSSVTLTCSTDANPPVQDCKLYKGKSYNGDGSIHTMSSVSSEDSGDYKCKCSYKSQEKYSAAVTLTVLYPPKTVRVSISPSGEKVEGSLETLSCSSDANPPVQSYTWFKEGGDSPVGSGQSYNVLQAGSYYCVAQNKYGNQTAAALSVTSNGSQTSYFMIIFVTVGVLCGVAALLGLFLCVRRKRQKRKREEHDYQNDGVYVDDCTYTALEPVSRSSNDVYSTLASSHHSPPDDTYTALDPRSISPDYDTLTNVRNQN